jgi:hypothetical protein
MKPMEIFRRAVAEIGDATSAELSAHLEKQHGFKIEPRFIPLYKATLRDLERMTCLRQVARPEQSAQVG